MALITWSFYSAQGITQRYFHTWPASERSEVMGIGLYLKIDKSALKKLRGDPAAMFWFGCLSDYSRRFRTDKFGYFRVSRKVVEDDYGLSRKQIQYLNLKLATMGVIEIDPVIRGGRIPTGYKIL
jgi:hypothetical protein